VWEWQGLPVRRRMRMPRYHHSGYPTHLPTIPERCGLGNCGIQGNRMRTLPEFVSSASWKDADFFVLARNESSSDAAISLVLRRLRAKEIAALRPQ